MKNDPHEIIGIFKTITVIEADDAVRFDPDSISVEQIREDDRYAGIRVHVDAYLGKANDRVQIDIGFGDAVTPGPVEMQYPTLLPTVPKPELQAYPFETVIAEKWEATISLGDANTRFKDQIDLEQLARTESFDGALIQEALRATFRRRGTAFDLGATPLGSAYRDDRARQSEYATARTRLKRANAPEQFSVAMSIVLAFLEPIYRACAEGRDFAGTWDPAGQRWR